MNSGFKKYKYSQGFSLAEVIAALTIAAMVLVAVLGIYNRAQRSAAAITRKLRGPAMAFEVLQRIAEDLDKVTAAPGADTKITIENKLSAGHQLARMKIITTIRDNKNKEQKFEEIIWQSSFDSVADSLVLYRSYSGMVLEDKLLDEQRKGWEKQYSFVPICDGVTFFGIQVPRGDSLGDKWTADSLPNGVVVTISFSEPVEMPDGSFKVSDSEKITRTIAVDRTRKINFKIVKKEYSEEESDEQQNP